MKFSVARMIARTKRTRQTEIVLPAIVPTGAQRDALYKIYARLVREWERGALDKVLATYTRTLGEGLRDSVDDVQGDVDELTAAMQRLVLRLTPLLENWVVQVEEWHRGRFSQLFTPTGVNLDTFLGRGDVRTTLQAILGENTALIRSLDAQMQNGISGAVFRGLTNRTPARDVAREIRKVANIGRRRAELIAADQLQKLTGRLDQERQEQVGVDRFKWRHSHKAHPRPEHVARDGKIYKWDGVVARTDPPGRAIRCGCRAQPVISLETIMASDD